MCYNLCNDEGIFSSRLLDGAPATIEVLGGIVDAVKVIDSHMEVYMDGGIRKGLDVYRALAIGKANSSQNTA